MASLMISMPLALRRSDRQDEQLVNAEATLDALQAEHRAMVNRLNADVAEAYATLEKERARLALFVRSIIPHGRAALESATAAYEVARAEFVMVLTSQTTLYDYEIAYFRALTDFAIALAAMERVVGGKVLP
jgi:outer membrane protein TolC